MFCIYSNTILIKVYSIQKIVYNVCIPSVIAPALVVSSAVVPIIIMLIIIIIVIVSLQNICLRFNIMHSHLDCCNSLYLFERFVCCHQYCILQLLLAIHRFAVRMYLTQGNLHLYRNRLGIILMSLGFLQSIPDPDLNNRCM